MSNTVKGLLWGVLGAAFALVLSLGAFAVAGDSIGDPAEPIPVPSVTSSEATHTPESGETSSSGPGDDGPSGSSSSASPTGTSSSSEGGDDHGGDDNSGHGSDDSGSGSDNSGHGSDDD